MLFFKIISDGIRKAYDKLRNGKEYRQYQADTLQNLTKVRSNGGKRALVKLATGGGKTTIATMDMMIFSKQFEKENGRKPRILWLAHTKELLDQAEEDIQGKIDTVSEDFEEARIKELALSLGLEEKSVGEQLKISTTPKSYDEGILVASVQKMSYGDNLDRVKGDFDYIVIDEAHHSYADSYMRIIEKYKDAFIVGLTATPQRFSDSYNVERLFEEIVVDLNLVDMVNMGHLSTMYFHRVDTEITVDSDEKQKGDYTLSALWKKFGEDGQLKRDQLVVDTYLNLKEQKGHYSRIGQGAIDFEQKAKAPAVTYAMNVAHAKDLVKLYKENGVRAEMLYGGMGKKTREYVLGRYKGSLCSHAFSKYKGISAKISLEIRNNLVLSAVLDKDRFSLGNEVDVYSIELQLPESLIKFEKQIREELFLHSKEGKLQMLVSINILNEGFDFPAMEVALMARPTRSKTIYMQQIGRLARKSEDTGKQSALIIDFVDNMGMYSTAIFHEKIFIPKIHDIPDGTDPVTDDGDVLDNGLELINIDLVDIVDIDLVEIFGGIDILDFDEDTMMGITKEDAEFKQIYGDCYENFKVLKELLDAAWEVKEDKRENMLVYEGVEFYKTKIIGAVSDKWTTDKTNLEAVANILGKTLYIFEIRVFDKTTMMGITGKDAEFSKMYGATADNARDLNELLDVAWEAKEDKSENKLVYEGVEFYRSTKGQGHPSWATDKSNFESVKIIICGKFEIRVFDKTTMMGITRNDEEFKKLFGSDKNNARDLNELLDVAWEAKEDKSENNLVYEGVEFYNATKGLGKPVWTTDKTNLEAVAKILGRKLKD